MDIDYAIKKDEPLKISDTITPDQILLYERWEKSNRLSVMYIKTKISAGIHGSIEQHENVHELLKAIDEQFITSDKALANTLIMKFTSLKFTDIKGVREYIMEMRDVVAQLKKLEVEMCESFLVHFILNTLSPQYGPFKISYNTHKDKWSINELMTMCVQGEGRLMMEQGESVVLVTQKKGKSQTSQKMKHQIPPKVDIKKDEKCFFCKKKGHVKQKCLKFQKWLEKKESQLSTSSDKFFVVHNTPQVRTGVEQTIVEVQPITEDQPVIEVPQVVDNISIDQVDQELPGTFEQQVEPHTSLKDNGATLRRSTRTKKSTIPSDYIVYLQESNYNIGVENDPESFSQVMSYKESQLWYNAMKDEMSSMRCKDVCDLVELPNGAKSISCK
ncbi:hypothetical protein VitviT2T_002425 [Vitis vinifera]|uniref:CCHC-type domain-containing protein n=1 Tax=Vitis vinifera TaxID=29760 RepID=A0ABY9BIM1_VITVI|nr:hypothetical protein VitviT2T_002425 [Vitis vinifera]